MKKLILFLLLTLIKTQDSIIEDTEQFNENDLPKREKKMVELQDMRIVMPIEEGSKIKRKIIRIYNRRKLANK